MVLQHDKYDISAFKRNRQVIILHKLSNRTTFVFSPNIEHCCFKEVFFSEVILEIYEDHVTAYSSTHGLGKL